MRTFVSRAAVAAAADEAFFWPMMILIVLVKGMRDNRQEDQRSPVAGGSKLRSGRCIFFFLFYTKLEEVSFNSVALRTPCSALS